MKKILMIITIVSSFAACKNGSKSDLETNKAILTNSSSADDANASSGTRSNTSTSTGTGTNTIATQNTTHRKGWSSRAKGAVIGGTAGAVGGAIVSKHKGTGAVIGGVVGAAGGYIIGNEKDKKNNR